MKVIIDISDLHSDALRRGVGFYTQNIYKALCGLKDGNKYIFRRDRTQKIEADINHYPYFDPFFLTLPLYSRKPFIITIHDLIPLKFPEFFPSGIRGKIKWCIQKKIAKQAKAIITDSKNSKRDIMEIISYSEDNIYPIYLAPGEEFKQIAINNQQLAVLKKKYQLPKSFILYVGDLNWNKNVNGLIKAFPKTLELLNPASPAGGSKTLKLVLVGSVFYKDELVELQELKKLIKELKIKDDVKFLGFVPTNDLVGIYNLATLYVQPSFYEGFGLPVLEAMACGCPVLSSNKGSLLEVGGQAVEYFDPSRKGDMEKRIGNLINNFNKLNSLKNKGFEQVKKFSWKKTALETRKVYEKALFKKY